MRGAFEHPLTSLTSHAGLILRFLCAVLGSQAGAVAATSPNVTTGAATTEAAAAATVVAVVVALTEIETLAAAATLQQQDPHVTASARVTIGEAMTLHPHPTASSSSVCLLEITSRTLIKLA